MFSFTPLIIIGIIFMAGFIVGLIAKAHEITSGLYGSIESLQAQQRKDKEVARMLGYSEELTNDYDYLCYYPVTDYRLKTIDELNKKINELEKYLKIKWTESTTKEGYIKLKKTK